jgi:membrane-associated phospholipid phosphatase
VTTQALPLASRSPSSSSTDVAGAVFSAAAVIVGAGRVLIGAHYPADVLAGCLVGLGCALLVARVANRIIKWLVRLVERVTDPLLAPLWRRHATTQL